MSSRADDRSTKARIRDAAIECVGTTGFADTTVRAVATAAGVSPALVIHHYGSMDGLRQACDDHVVSAIRRIKTEQLATTDGLDPLAGIRDAGQGPPLLRYLSALLVQDAPQVTDLLRDLIDDAVAYVEVGIASGTLRPLDDVRGCVTVMTFWSLGAAVLGHHLQAILGVDIRDASSTTDVAAAGAYMLPATEILNGGLITDQAAAAVRAAFASAATPTGVSP